MKNLIEVSVDSIRIHMPTAQHLVILKEKEADRYLPIWIGSFEAQAIATKISGNPLGRPLTHDLMATAFGDLGVSVKRIVVTRLADQVFYARLYVKQNGRDLDFDARPSDAIALAVRMECPIFVATEVMEAAGIIPEAYCESMCVFLLLSGKARYVPETAHVRVHQIWMGDRADDAKAASYSAHDLMIVERDIGRLAKYTFDMGGAGDLLSLSLNVPPWEDLHELSPAELRLTNLVTTDAVAEVLPHMDTANVPVADAAAKPVQDRFVSKAMEIETNPQSAKSTKTAEAHMPTGVVAAPPQPPAK